MSMDDARQLRSRHRDRLDRADRYGYNPLAPPTYLGQVYNGGSIPTAVPRVYLTRPLSISTNDTENATPTFTPDTGQSVPVLVLGTAPTAGTNLLAEMIDGRWVADLRVAIAACGGTLTVNVKCGGVNRSGATVTITLGATTLTATTNASGNATFTPGASGTWSITITLSGFQTYTGTFTFSCANQTLNLTISGASNTFSGQVRAFCTGLAISGATVEIRSGGTLYATTTTDASGNWTSTFAGPGASYTVTFIKTGFDNLIVSSLTMACNGSVVVGAPYVTMLTDTANYMCFGCRGPVPMPHSSTISMSVSWAGSPTLSYSSTYNKWVASYTYSGAGRIYTAADPIGSVGTTFATGVAATILLYAADPLTSGSTGAAGYYAWCLKSPATNYIMSDAYVAANPAKVEQRIFWSATGDNPCATSAPPMLVTFAQFMQPDISISPGVTPGGTASFTE